MSPFAILYYFRSSPNDLDALLLETNNKFNVEQDLQRNNKELNIEEILTSIRQLKQFVNTMKANQVQDNSKNKADDK